MPRRPAVPEAAWQSSIVEVAQRLGWRTYYVPDWIWRMVMARTKHEHRARDWAEPGWPDLTLVHEEKRRLIFAECKSATGVVRDSQKAWLAALTLIPGVEVYVWRPADWDDVLAILQAEDAPRLTPVTT